MLGASHTHHLPSGKSYNMHVSLPFYIWRYKENPGV